MDSTAAAAAAAVRAFYDFLNAKDAEGLYGLLAENIEWDCNEIATSAQKAGVPWLQTASGKQALIEMSAKGAAVELDTSKFQFCLKQVVVDGDAAFSVSETTIACRRTGKSVRTENVHQFGFDAAGKISKFRHWVDTGAHVYVWTPDEQMPAAWAAMGTEGAGAIDS